MLGPIVIIGSINMDLICRTPHIPRGGETVLGDHFMTLPGGKGANQAVAAAKLAQRGQPVHMIGRVGDDDFGQRLLNGLEQHNVNTNSITITEGVASGVAVILVDRRGENSITVSPGANAQVLPRDIDAAESLIRSAAVVVLQLEIPLATVRHAIALCRQHGVYTILDPAPAPEKPLPRSLYQVDLFTPNQSEAEILLGMTPTHRVKKKRVEDPKQIAADLLSRGPKSVVLKLGAKGSIAAGDGAPLEHVRAYKLKVVDTTAAGDAFTAALAVARAEQLGWHDTLKFANAAGALTTTSFGAQPALPSREAVDQLIKRSAR
ncbi:MAG: ribokinase [Anaerolineae bacterium]|nr:ribokinase [Phycisphaerae bacterium]